MEWPTCCVIRVGTTRVVMAVGTSAHKNHKLTWTCFATHLPAADRRRLLRTWGKQQHCTVSPRQMWSEPFPINTWMKESRINFTTYKPFITAITRNRQVYTITESPILFYREDYYISVVRIRVPSLWSKCIGNRYAQGNHVSALTQITLARRSTALDTRLWDAVIHQYTW